MMEITNTLVRVCVFMLWIAAVCNGVSVKEGESATLECPLDQTGDNHVIWTNPSGTALTFDDWIVVDDSRIRVNSASGSAFDLQVNSVQMNDAGQYVCHLYSAPFQRAEVNLVVYPEKCEACTQRASRHNIISNFCQSDIVSKVVVVGKKEVGDDLVLTLGKWKGFYKYNGLSKAEASGLTTIIKGGSFCTCDAMNTSNRTRYLLMGKREGDSMVVAYATQLNYRNRNFRKAIRAFRRKNVCAQSFAPRG